MFKSVHPEYIETSLVRGRTKMLKDISKMEKEKSLFQMVFLKDNKDQSVEVEEFTEISCDLIRTRLEQGESVFITRKRTQKLRSN
jgi:hypothetical protein